MSVTLLSAITAVLQTRLDDDLTKLFNRACVLSRLLPFKQGTGKGIYWAVSYGDLPGSSILASGSDVSVYNADTKAQATLAYGSYSEAFGVSGQAWGAAYSSGNPEELAELAEEEMEAAITRLTGNINLDCWTGYGTDSIVGLADTTYGAIIATGTYAGISKSGVPSWAGNEEANGGQKRNLTLSLMRNMKRKIYVASGLHPDLIVCDPVQHEEYGNLLGDKRRYMQEVTLRGQKIVLDGGYQALEFDGVPVIQDKDCPSGKMFFLNSAVCRMTQGPSAPPFGEQGEEEDLDIPLHGTPEEQMGEGNLGMKARINPLAVTGDAAKFQLVVYPQLVVKRPNACGILSDLNY